MEDNIVWWAWIIVGAIFLLVELMTTTFFGLWMAIAALVPAVVSLIWPSAGLEWQLTLWIVAMLLCGWLWARYSRRGRDSTLLDDPLAGQVGVLARACDHEITGLLLLQKPVAGASEWRCLSEHPLPAETRVVVIEQIDKHLVRVEKAQPLHQKQRGSE